MVSKCEVGVPFSDHNIVETVLCFKTPRFNKKSIEYRKIHSIDVDMFKSDIESLGLSEIDTDSVDVLVSAYDMNLRNILDKHAPKKSINVIVRPNIPWYDTKIEASKRHKRKLESIWRKSRLPSDKSALKQYNNTHIKLINSEKKSFFSSKIEDCGSDHKKLFGIINTLLGKRSTQTPSFASGQALADTFNEFFIEKIRKIKCNLDVNNSVFIPDAEPKAI